MAGEWRRTGAKTQQTRLPAEPSRRASSTAPARHACPRRSWPVYTGAASTSDAARRRWRRDKTPAWGLAQPVAASGSEPEPEPWSAAAAACPVARLARAAGGSGALAARALCSAACWTRRSFGRFAGDTLVPASLFDCAGAACLPAAQLGPASLSAQARPRRRLLLEGSGDVTRRQAWLRCWAVDVVLVDETATFGAGSVELADACHAWLVPPPSHPCLVVHNMHHVPAPGRM